MMGRNRQSGPAEDAKISRHERERTSKKEVAAELSEVEEVIDSGKEIYLLCGCDVYRTTIGGLVEIAYALKDKEWVSVEDLEVQLKKHATRELDVMLTDRLIPSNWDYVYLKHTRVVKKV
jgi:hypothetical protein